ncbi:MAG: BamA/TamA family outer membrane protein [Bacteroidales bacterium]|nr:BamA/TamA family outer membrane protein [Bacteroidales bacterium]
MMKHLYKYILFVLLIASASCSTTRVIPQGESRLKENKIKVLNSKNYQVSGLEPYIKQKPNSYFILGWNPFLNIYNWSNGKDNGWDRFVKKIGQEPEIFDPTLVDATRENISNHLVYQGYYGSEVTDKVVTEKKKTTVHYNIELGKQYIIGEIKYKIEDEGLAEVFRKDSLSSFIESGKYLSEEYLNAQSEKIAKYLRDKGYFGFTKNYLFFSADTIGKDGYADLDVSIRNYTRNETPENARKHEVFHFGQVSMEPMRKPSNPLVYQFVGDSAVAIPAMNLYTPTDSTIYRNILIKYRNEPLLRKRVLARMNYVHPNSLYNEQKVSDTYTRLTNLKLFSSVNIQMNQVDSNTVDCNMRLTASELQGYKLGLETSINSTGLFGISPSVSYYHKNLFRGAELFSVNLMGDFQFAFNSEKRATEFGVSTSLSTPNFLLLPDRIFNTTNIPRTEFAVSYNYQERPEYTRNIISGSYSYVWSRRDRFFYKVSPLQVGIVKLSNMKPDFYESLTDPFLINSYQDHFDLGLGTSFYYTTDSSPRPAHSYFYLRWQNDLSGNLLSLFNSAMKKNSKGERLIWDSPYSQYYRTEASTVYTWRLGKTEKHSIAARFLAGVGVGYGNSVTLPFEKRFWAGGAYSLRAWQARTVGPGYAQMDTTFTIPNQTGDVRLEANLEYRFPLFWNFEGAFFVDAGNVWNLKRSTSGNDNDAILTDSSKEGEFKFSNFYRHLAADWGVGIRLDLSFVLLRLDMGIKLYDPSEKDWKGPDSFLKKGNYGVQFGVGYPF